MTVIAAVMVRSYTGPDMFADIPGLADVVMERVLDKQTGVTTLTFDADLTVEQAAEVRCRMTSRDDVDQAKRADLRAKRDAVNAAPTLENMAALDVAMANYQLGD